MSSVNEAVTPEALRPWTVIWYVFGATASGSVTSSAVADGVVGAAPMPCGSRWCRRR